MRLLLDVVTAVIRRPFLILLFLAGNAVLFALFWLWLSMPDRTAADLAGSAVIAAAVVLGGGWLYGTTLAAFHTSGGGYGPALRRLPRLLPWALIVLAAFLLGRWLLGALAALLLVPILSQAAGGGFSFRAAVRMLARPLYWLFALPLGAAGVVLPGLLIWWLPEADGIMAQTISLVARFSLAALLAALSWLLLASATGHLGREAPA
ncbi:MAG: hypothetical protein GY953_46585 [bacterium]|nr:hypothetical protein [bacterium]